MGQKVTMPSLKPKEHLQRAPEPIYTLVQKCMSMYAHII